MLLVNQSLQSSLIRSKKQKRIAFNILMIIVVSSVLLMTNLGNINDESSRQSSISLEKIGEAISDLGPQQNLELFTNSESFLDDKSDKSEDSNLVDFDQAKPTSFPTWLEYARNTPIMSINAANGTLKVNTQTGSTILANTPIEIRNSTNSIIASGLSDGSGNFTITDLLVGNYTVIIQQDNNITSVVEINDGQTETILANFGRLQVITEDEEGSPVDATIEVRDSSDSSIEIANEQTGPAGDKILIVAPMIYDINAFFGYGQSKPTIAVNDGSLSSVTFVFGSIEGKFGSIVVSSHGHFDMPLSSSVTIRNYTSGVVVTSGSTNSYTGLGTWVLAPDIYTVEVNERTTVVNQSVVVEPNTQTNISVHFGILIVYQDNTTNTLVEIFNEVNSLRIFYDYIQATSKLVALTLAQGTYNVHYSGQNHLITIGKGERILINSQINTAPSLLSVSASPSRINANETTNLTVSLTDINYDYNNINFTWISNVGTITGQDQQNRFTNEGVFSSTITYHAPTTLQTMYIDIFANDTFNGNFSYRIYVSNRQGTISVNSTQLDGVGKSSTLIELYQLYTGSRTIYDYTNSSGWVTFSNIYEDEYYLRAREGNFQLSSIFHFDTSTKYLYQFKWGLMHVNSTALNRALINTGVSVYNQSTDEYYTQGTTSTTGMGYFTFFLSAGTYKLKAVERNDIWKNEITIIPEQEQFLEFQFSVFAVYYLDGNEDPQSKLVQFYNRTTGIRVFYDYTSVTGFVVLIVAPYNNYSIVVTHNGTYSYVYEPLSIAPNEGQNIGQFTNHLPVITGYSASPSTVTPSGNTTITITAVDQDVLDVLTYTYRPSLGSIVGSGSSVTYFAPAGNGFYYLNISVVDPHDGFDNITRSLSARTATVQVNLTDFEDNPLVSSLLEIYDWTTGVRYSYNYADANGVVTFLNVPESFYYLRGHGSNVMTSDIFLSGDSQFYYNFKFGGLFVNSTAGNLDLIATRINVLPSGSSVIESNGNTVLTGTGQVRFDLRPDNYDIRGDEVNSLFYRNISIVENTITNLTFKWAEFNITSLTVMNMPLPSLWEIYNSTTSIRYIYNYLPALTGKETIYVAPGLDYQVRIHGDNAHILNVIGIANVITNVEGRFGVLQVSQTDRLGIPVSTSIYVKNSTTDVTIISKGTGTDGVCFFYLINGSYRITNTTTGTENVLIIPLQSTKVEFGDKINNSPSLLSVTASPARIGPSSSTIVTIQASDVDFDYETMNVSILLSIGSLGTSSIGWIQSDRWYYQVEYFSPAISTQYQLNITLTDGQGGSRFFMLMVSNLLGTFNLHSQGNAFQGQVTNIVVYRVSTGEVIFSGNTNATGTVIATIQEDYYNIRATEHNVMWLYGIWLKGGDVIDITFLWGELTVYSSGVGGEPLAGTLVEVFNQETGFRYTYDYTNTEGKVHFVLAPGVYKIKLTQASSIIFDNIVIVGGSTLALGSEIPSTTRPADVIYPEGRMGNNISWELTDTNPGYYNVILDGSYVINSTIWTNGTIVTISVNGLIEGEHYAALYVNDITGYEQYDIVIITVTPYIGNPTLLSPLNVSYNNPHVPVILQNTSTIEDSWYQYQLEGNWSDNQSLTWDGSYWIVDIIWNPGSYHLRTYIRDLYGFEIESNSYFTILPTEITLISPLNNSIVQSEVGIVVEILGTTSFMFNWDQIVNHSHDVSGLIEFILPVSEGLHTFEVYGLDARAIWIKRIYTFTVDDTAPEINPFDDISDGSEVGTGTSIPFSIFDSHFENFWFYWNNSEGITPAVFTDIPWAEVPTVTGTWTLNVLANDSAGNLEHKSIRLIILTATQISLIYPNGGEIIGGFVNVTWSTSENLTYNLFYSPDSGLSWVELSQGLTDTFYIWDTSSTSLNGSTYLVRVISTTSGKPGELKSENVFTILNIIQIYLPEGTTEIEFPDIDISVTVDEGTNVTIQRLTEVSTLMDPNASDFIGYGLFLEITLENPDALEVLVVSFSVAHLMETLEAQGLTIFDVEVYFYNETSNQWELADSTIRDLVYFIVTGTFDHTTTIGALGKTRETATSSFGPVLFAIISLVAFSVGGGALLMYDHTQKTQAGKISYYSQIEEAMKNIYNNTKKRFEKEG